MVARVDVPGLLAQEFVRVPPLRRHVWVPVATRRRALSGLCLFTASRRSGLLLQYGSFAGAWLVGPHALPGRRQTWAPPVPAETWGTLMQDMADKLGPFDATAVYERPQASRSGVALMLLRSDRQVAFVKMRAEGGEIGQERRILQALDSDPQPSFSAPSAIGWGEHGGWHWLAMSALPPRPHRPQRKAPIDDIVSQIQAALRPAMAARPSGLPDDWVPLHGDLTPWNLRLVDSRRLWLLDWEDATWGPPQADVTYYRATAAAMYGDALRAAPPDAVDFWLERLSLRSRSDYDTALNVALTRALHEMRVL